jgi:peptidoglycan/xylan/chitin deacetylase (PgdA/CDA1 family)/glycosyltransferase involved in cell wall biosynthesis
MGLPVTHDAVPQTKTNLRGDGFAASLGESYVGRRVDTSTTHVHQKGTVAPLRVAITVPANVVAGAEVWLFEILDEVDHLNGADGIEFCAILLADNPDFQAAFERRGIETRVLPTGKHPWDLALSAVSLRSVLKNGHFDIVLAIGIKSGLVSSPAGILSGTRVVWARHDHTFSNVIGRTLAASCDTVIATSEELLESIGQSGKEIFPRVLPAAAPASRSDAQAFWTDRGLSFDMKTVAMATRLIAYKGVDDAIRALALPEGTDWQLAVIGEDDPSAIGCEDSLRTLARNVGVEDRVIFLGFVPGASHWLAAFDAVAVLTKPLPEFRLGREGYGVPVVEAALAGTPSIATVDTPQPFGEDVCVRVQPNDPSAVAAALSRVVDCRPNVAAQAEAVRRERPTAKVSSDRLLNLLANVAQRPGVAAQRDRLPKGITVVTTVLNEGTALDALVDRLVLQLADADQLVIVDGGSTDGSIERVQQTWISDERIRIIHAPGAGISQGRNIGVRSAANEFIAFTDAGCVPGPNWLSALKHAFASEPQPDLVTGTYSVVSRNSIERANVFANYPDVHELLHPTPLSRVWTRLFGRAFDPILPTGRSSAVRKTAFEKVGGFREDLPFAEDVSLGKMFAEANFRCILAADADVAWEQRPNLKSTAKMYRSYGKGDALSGDRQLIGRNVVRALAYAVGPAMLLRGGIWRKLGLAGATFALSVPFRRAARNQADLATVSTIPFALALKDLEKVWGCTIGLVEKRRRASGPKCLVLMYHAFGERTSVEDPHALYVTADRLREQLQYLKGRGHTFVTVDQYARACDKGTLPRKSVLITIDDGYRSILEIAAPVFEEFGVRPVVYVPLQHIGGTSADIETIPFEPFMDLQELQELRRRGWGIGAHGFDHVPMRGRSLTDLERDTVETKRTLEELIGAPITTFAYPIGIFDEEARIAVQKAGYAAAFSVHRPGGRYAHDRVPVNSLDTRTTFALKAIPGFSRMWRFTGHFKVVRPLMGRLKAFRP